MATISSNSFNLSKIENAVFTIYDEEETSFFITTFNIPGLSIGTIPTPNPFKEHQEPGNKLTFEELQLSVIVDEEFQAWKNMNDWIREGSNGFTFSSQSITRRAADIILLTNNMNPKYKVSFKNVFPINIGSIEFDVQQAEPVPPTFSATLQYESYTFSTL